jgi:hypothetical protein
MDQLDFTSELIMIFLIVMIFGLFFLDFIIQKVRRNEFIVNLGNIKISKYTFIIMLFAIGVLLVSLGIQFNALYLIRGDSWVGVMPTNYIGRDNMNAIEDRTIFRHYPMFWGYIVYALSMLSGIPYVNVNVMIAPFCYLYINTIYLLMKAILFEIKEKYIVLSTMLMSIFSGISFFFYGYHGEVGRLGIMSLCQFYFIYKTFGYLLLFLSMAIFIILTKPNKTLLIKYRQILVSEEHKYLILTAFFLIIGFMTYMLPLLMGVCLIFFYCIFSENKNKSYNFQFFTILIFYLSFFFLIFDAIMLNYLSWISIAQFQIFSQIKFITHKSEINSIYYIIYLFFFGVFISSMFFQYFLNLVFNRNIFNRVKQDMETNHRIGKKMKIFLIIYSIFLIIEIIGKFYEVFFKIDALSRSFYLYYYLDLIFLYIGFIGIIGIYLSYYCFKKNNNLFIILVSWIIFSISLALLLITRNSLIFYPELPKEIPERESTLMIIWYERFWFYSIPPLCIFASIGIMKLIKIFQNHVGIQKNRYFKHIIKYTSVSVFIFLTFSGLTTAGMKYGSDKSSLGDNEVLVIGWVSENLPRNSRIMIERTYDIERGLQTMTICRVYYIHKEINENINEAEYNKTINHLKDNEIEYLLISMDFLADSKNISLFVKNYLRSDFYSEKVYDNDDYVIYYAPYFD